MVPELSLEWILERHKLVNGFSLPPFHVVSGSSFESLNANPRTLGADECSVLVTELLKANGVSQVSHLVSLEASHYQ